MTSGTREQPRAARAVPVAVVIAAVFVATRAAIVHSRTIFFDELFSAWMARQPLASLLDHLKVDSGPPLYYLVARLHDVVALRWLSVAFAAVPLLLLLKQRRWIAALLLAIHPAAALFAATARPYALAATLIAIAILLLERDRAWPAAAALIAAAYTHYLGVLFFPAIVFCRAPVRQRIAACLVAGIAFVPGFLLSMTQPKAATAWMTAPDLQHVLTPLTFLSDDPGVDLWVTILAAGLTILAASRSWRRHAAFVVVPLALVVALSFVRPALYGIRFASLTAFPLVLWLEQSLESWRRATRLVLTLALVGIASIAIAAGVIEHLNRPDGDYRKAAMVLRQNVRPDETVVATGYLFLETTSQLPGRRIRAFPPEQGVHPGWRALPRQNVDLGLLPRGEFVWIGEKAAPELAAIRRGRQTRVLYANGRAAILRVW